MNPDLTWEVNSAHLGSVHDGFEATGGGTTPSGKSAVSSTNSRPAGAVSAGPLVKFLREKLAGQFDLKALERHDSKYERLRDVIRMHLCILAGGGADEGVLQSCPVCKIISKIIVRRLLPELSLPLFLGDFRFQVYRRS